MTGRARLATIGAILFVSFFIGACGSGSGCSVWYLSTDGGSSSGGNTPASNAPTITDFGPRSGSAGLPVTIRGTHFGTSRGSGVRDGGTASVTFNGTDAGSSDYVQWSDTQIVVNVPAGATQGKITVTTPAGSASTDSDFTVARKIVAGGDFTRFDSATRWGIARVNADGTIDKTFHPGAGADKTVYCVARQGDGKILIGGDFQHYNGTAVNRIARLNADGSLDTSFFPGTGPDQAVYSLLAESDGKILIGGAFTSYNGTARNKMARLNADGTLDTTLFNLATISMVRCMVKQADGKILVGGDIAGNIARLETDGTVDPAFTSPMYFEGTVYSLAVLAEGKILIGGSMDHYNGVPQGNISRLNADGTLDATFNAGGVGAIAEIYGIVPVEDGKILIGGVFVTYNGVTQAHVGRLNADGSLDTMFYQGGVNDAINCLTLPDLR